METSIQVSTKLLEKLKYMKMYSKESYEEIIWDLIEDRLELSEEAKRDIEASREDIKAGRTISLERLKKKIGA